MSLLEHASVAQQAFHADTTVPAWKDSSFFSWTETCHIQHCCVLAAYNEMVIPVQAVGIDAQSIIKIVSLPAFWRNTLTNIPTWQSFFTNATLSPFSALFSEQCKSSLQSLHCLLINKQRILLLFTLESESVTLPDYASTRRLPFLQKTMPEQLPGYTDSRTPACDAHFFILSTKLAIETVMRDCTYSKKNLQAPLKTTIFCELQQIVQKLFQFPSCICRGNDDEIKIVFFSKTLPDEQLLQFHIIQNFAPVLGLYAAQSVVLLHVGDGSSASDIQNFLERA